MTRGKDSWQGSEHRAAVIRARSPPRVSECSTTIRSPGVLPLHPGRTRAAPLEPGIVPIRTPSGSPSFPGHVVPQVVTHQVRVPPGRRERPLHPVRGCLARVLGQRPAARRARTRTSRREETACDHRERIIKPCPQLGPLNIVRPGQRGHRGYFSSGTPRHALKRLESGPARGRVGRDRKSVV